MDNDKPLEPLAISVDETARVISHSRSSVYKLRAAGHLQAVKSGTKTLILYSSVKQWLASLQPAPVKTPRPRPRRRPPGKKE
jgi:excisionase family DNA binding protein